MLVWREGFRAQLKCISSAERAFLEALLAGESLDSALTKAGCAEEQGSQPAFDFTEWLAHAFKTSLVTGAGLINNDDFIQNQTGASS